MKSKYLILGVLLFVIAVGYVYFQRNKWDMSSEVALLAIEPTSDMAFSERINIEKDVCIGNFYLEHYNGEEWERLSYGGPIRGVLQCPVSGSSVSHEWELSNWVPRRGSGLFRWNRSFWDKDSHEEVALITVEFTWE